MIARAKSVAARSWTCSKPRHTGLTTMLRPTCDRKMLQSWVYRRKNIRLVTQVVRDRKGQISRNKVDGHVQNLKPAIPNRKRSHDLSCNWSCHLTTCGTTNRSLTDTIKCGDVSGVQWHNPTIDRTIDRRMSRLICDRSQNPTIDRTIDRRARRLIVRSIVGCHD